MREVPKGREKFPGLTGMKRKSEKKKGVREGGSSVNIINDSFARL
ncbi:hypothetical protein [Methanosarcina sp. KYL-1]|nr:hypothetical protein [Methanosarcina sp. KYL-1]